MSKISILLISFSILLSCTEKGGKSRRIIFPKQIDQHLQRNQNEIRVEALSANSMSISLRNEGLIDKSTLTQRTSRYLRMKILNQAFLSLRNAEHPKEILISDEFRFFPGEVSGKTKMTVNEQVTESNSAFGRWSLDGRLKFKGLGDKDIIKNVIVSLGSATNSPEDIIHYGQDLIRKRDGQSVHFFNAEEKSFSLSYSNLPIDVMNELTKVNGQIFLEIIDFDINGKKIRERLKNERENKTRVVISSTEGEAFYFLENGQSLYSFLKRIDSNVKLNYRGKISSLMGKQQDDLFSYVNRSVLDNLELYGDKKVWWSNLDESIDAYKADGSTIVLAHSTLSELRNSQYRWKEIKLKFEDHMDLKSLNAQQVMGKVSKISSEYKFIESTAVIPFEIGEKVCMERHDRKASDCSIRWRAAFSYPTARFRRQIIEEGINRKLENKEFQIGEEYINVFFDVEAKGLVKINNLESLNVIPGGFIGWEIYDSRLNSYKTRAPFNNLTETSIKRGFHNEYFFNGWKRVYPFRD